MRKNKFLKTLGFSCMAVFMASLTILGGCSAPQLNNNVDKPPVSSSLGLDPKNDPVVYTTDSGLEIKMSNATNKYSGTTTVTTNKGYTYTQNLSSFYYFTMGTYSGTIYTGANTTTKYTVSNEPVNWIILGLGNNTGYFLDTVSANLFSTWKTNIEGVEHSNTTLNNYFFKEIYETISPAGNAIYSELATKAYIMEKVKASIPVNPGNLNEIPEGCMLVLSEKMLGQMYFNSTGAINALHTYHSNYPNTDIIYSGGGYYGNRYRYYGNSNTSGTQTWTISGNKGGDLYNYINNLFSKNNSTGAITGSNNLGFTQAQANLIVPQQLYTYYHNGSSHLQETPSTDGGTYYTMFPLAYREANTQNSIYQNFCIQDYLPNTANRISTLIGSSNNLSYIYWLRSGYYDHQRSVWRISVDGNGVHHYSCDCSYGVRPAMVMRLQ
ncbi:MAG: hypothetical protein IJF22_01020 [Clostridia bacterium]|nr:hypothetical protein [Clostridia bacterium]